MIDEARSQFLKLIRDYGKDIYKDPVKFRSLLTDYLKGKYKSERNVLVGSISAKVPERLFENNGVLTYTTLQSQCIDLIRKEGFESGLAQWAVDTWAIGFNIIDEKGTQGTPAHADQTPPQSEVRINNKARSLFLKLIDHYGSDIYLDPVIFNNLLSDYLKGKYKSERNVLVSAIIAGVPKSLNENKGAIAYAKLQPQCIDLVIQEGFGKGLAQWAVDTWATGFKIIENDDTDETNGYIGITSTPSGARVYLDDKLRGKTPLRLSTIPAGTYLIKCTLDGYQNWEQTIEVDPGELDEVVVRFIPKTARLPQPNMPPLNTPPSNPSPQSAPVTLPQPSQQTPGITWSNNTTIVGILVISVLLIGGLIFIGQYSNNLKTGITPSPTKVPVSPQVSSPTNPGKSLSTNSWRSFAGETYVDLRTTSTFNLEPDKKIAPLTIDIIAYPVMIHDTKVHFAGTSDMQGTTYETDRPSESAEYSITVKNKDTGRILIDERCANFAASGEPRQWVIRSDGPYIIDIKGRLLTLDLLIQ